MTVKSHAGWLPSEGQDAGSAPAQQVSDAEALRSGEAQLISGRARVDTEGLDLAQGEAAALPASAARALSEDEIAAGGFFRERVIEVAETREEAVVEKDVVVREEVVLRKQTEERVETIRESVRRTEVDVEEMGAPERDVSPES